MLIFEHFLILENYLYTCSSTHFEYFSCIPSLSPFARSPSRRDSGRLTSSDSSSTSSRVPGSRSRQVHLAPLSPLLQFPHAPPYSLGKRIHCAYIPFPFRHPS